jgi:hypothetical protein
MFSAEAADSFTQFCHIYENTKSPTRFRVVFLG